MQLAKFQNHSISVSGKELFFIVLNIYGRCGHFNLPCDLDHLNKLLFLLPKEALHEIWIAWPRGFRGGL